jgi:hypothetical protein
VWLLAMSPMRAIARGGDGPPGEKREAADAGRDGAAS